MNGFVFGTGQQHYLAVDESGLLIADSSSPQLFLVETPEAEPVLNTVRNLYLCARADGLVSAAGVDPEQALVLKTVDGAGEVLCDRSGRIAIAPEDGGHVRLVPRGESVKGLKLTRLSPEPFVQEIFGKPPAAGNCCGPHEPGILWNDPQHHHMIDRAVLLLEVVDPSSFFLDLWIKPGFRDAVYEGIKDADYVDPYNNPATTPWWHGTPLYTSHFWNPATDRTLIEAHAQIMFLIPMHWNLSARTAAERYYKMSREFYDSWIRSGLPENLRQAGYFLGIALHYLTDLTQPMHAANFANMVGAEEGDSGEAVDAEPAENWEDDDFRHRGFEKCADKLVELTGRGSPLVRQSAFNFDPGKIHWALMSVDTYYRPPKTADEIVKAAAVFANQLYNSSVKALARKKKKDGKFNNEWTEAETDSTYQLAFPYGQRMTAIYLWLWARNSPAVQLGALYASLLGRRPTGLEIEEHSAAIERGTTVLEIATGLARGREYAARNLSAGMPRKVQALFEHFLGRGPVNADEAGYWQSFIQEHGWKSAVEEAAAQGKESGPLGDAAAVEVRQNTTSTAYWPVTNRPAVFFRDNSTGFLALTTFDSGRNAWTTTKFSNFPRVDGDISAFFNPASGVSAFYRGENGDLNYVYWAGYWALQTLPYLVSGAISALMDPGTGKPAVFFRGYEGVLCYLYWNGASFAQEWVLPNSLRLAGGLSAVFDPVSRTGGRIGHPVGFGISDKGEVVHWLRNETWSVLPISNTAGNTPPRLAGAGLVSAVIDPRTELPAAFWASYGYEEKVQGNYKVLLRTQPQIAYTTRAGSLVEPEVRPDASLSPYAVSRSLSAVAGLPRAAVHLGVFTRGRDEKPLYIYTTTGGGWSSDTIAAEAVAGGISATLDPGATPAPHGAVTWRDSSGKLRMMRVRDGAWQGVEDLPI